MNRYKFNPFIEGLPTLSSKKELIEKIRVYPNFKLKDASRQDRLQACNDVMYYYEPLTRTIDFIEEAFNIIKEGYYLRTPEKIIDYHKEKNKAPYTTFFNDVEDHLENISHILNFTLIGDSGTGKSKSVEKLKLLLPPTIIHKSFIMTQVPLVHVECPPKGSPNQLIEYFLIKLDSILKSDYKADSKSMDGPELLDFMRRICIDHMIGCIVVDELHNIKANTDKEIDGVMKFIKTLSNVVKTPMIFIGTTEADEILIKSLQGAIRMQGIGSMEWLGYEPDDKDWAFFLEELWEVQVLKKIGKMSTDIMNFYKRETIGTIRLAIVLHLVAQRLCLKMGKETISLDILELAKNHKMFITEKMTIAVNEHDYDTLRQIPDLNPLRTAVYRSLTQNEINADEQSEYDELKKETRKKFPKVIDNLLDEAIIAVIKQFPKVKKEQKLLKIEKIVKDVSKSKKHKTAKEKLEPTGELIDLLQNYRDSEDRYQILKESGFILEPLKIVSL